MRSRCSICRRCDIVMKPQSAHSMTLPEDCSECALPLARFGTSSITFKRDQLRLGEKEDFSAIGFFAQLENGITIRSYISASSTKHFPIRARSFRLVLPCKLCIVWNTSSANFLVGLKEYHSYVGHKHYTESSRHQVHGAIQGFRLCHKVGGDQEELLCLFVSWLEKRLHRPLYL